MTRLPWNPGELGIDDPRLDAVADRLTAHADAAEAAPAALTARVQAAVDRQPIPRAQWWRRTAVAPVARGPLRLAAALAVVTAGVAGGLAFGELAQWAQEGRTGSTPPAVVTPSPSPTPSPTLTPSPSPSPTASPTQEPSASPNPVVEPSATLEAETPEPSESDRGGNSGPGGGGDDDDGSSGGGGGNSGPGGGD